MEINWRKIACPQEDGYDTSILCALDAKRRWSRKNPTTPITICDGNIAIALGGMNGMCEEFVSPEYMSDDRCSLLTQYLNAWKAGYFALTSYIDVLQAHYAQNFIGDGCISGHHILSDTNLTHTIYVTVNSLRGCADGIYHEFAHLRLETLGIGIETHDYALLQNPPEELYDSSVRFDKKRPISAVLHGLYAWLMFTENNYQQYVNNRITKLEFEQTVCYNIPKIENGWNEINQHARWTPTGAVFQAGLHDWTFSLLSRCRSELYDK